VSEIKVANTRVVGRYFTSPYLESITDTTNSTYGVSTNEAWPNSLTITGGGGTNGVIALSFSYGGVATGRKPEHLTWLAEDTTFYFINGTQGAIAHILIDRMSQDASPSLKNLTFSSSETNAMNIYWDRSTEPDWSNWRYWHVSGICLDSTKIRCSAVPFDSQALTYPAGTFYGRSSVSGATTSTGDVAYIRADETVGNGGFASAVASGKFVINTPSGQSHPVYIRVYRETGTNVTTATFYNTSGTGSTLNTSTNPNVAWGGPTGITPTAYRVKQVGGGTDTGYITANAGGLNVAFSASADVGGVGTDSDTQNPTFEFYIRASGYHDALAATFSATAYATAESTCFIGTSLLTMVDESGNFLEKIALEDGYTTYHADTTIPRYVKGQDGVVNRILDFRQHEGHGTLHGFNGSDNFVTGAHPFLTTDGWKAFDGEIARSMHPNLSITNLEVGDILIKYNSDTGEYYEEELTSVTSERRLCIVYSLDVTGPDSDTDGNDTYIVDDYVVHNK